jgi:hypothetical protein
VTGIQFGHGRRLSYALFWFAYWILGITYPFFLEYLKAVTMKRSIDMSVVAEDLKSLNEILVELERDLFFEHYKQLKLFYEYLAHTYQFDTSTYTVDPATGEIVPINNKVKVYFDKMTI